MTGFQIYMTIVFLGLVLTISLFLLDTWVKHLNDDHKFKIWWRKNIIQDLEDDL